MKCGFILPVVVFSRRGVNVGPRDSTYVKGSNAPLITFLASRFALVDRCAHPPTGPLDRI